MSQDGYTVNSAQLPPYADGVHLCLDELLYYKSHAKAWLPPAKSLWSQLNGQHQSRQLGRGMDFAEVRKYQAGDDIRAIDWRVSARTGKTHTKLFTEEREQSTILYIDLSLSMRFGSQLLFKSVQAAHFASLLAWLCVQQKDRIGAVINNGIELIEIKPVSGNKGALQLCHELIKANQMALEAQSTQNLDISSILKTIHRLSPKGSDLFFLSDFPLISEDHLGLLSQLRQHNRMQFVHLYDPLELGQTAYRGSEYVTDHNSTQWLDFSQNATRNELKKHWDTHQKMIEHICHQLAIPYTRLSSGKALLACLNQSGDSDD